MIIDLRCGRWEEVLADVAEVDAVITDCPYSERTHTGHDAATPDDGVREKRLWARKSRPGVLEIPIARQSINYTAWSPADVAAFVDHWSPRCRGWFCTITDHVLAPHWAEAMERHGRYVFAPLPIVEPGSRVRLTGDGPSTWTCWLVVGRPKSEEFRKWGTLPGAYIGRGRGDREHIGGKDSGIMRSIIRDYTRPGDIVCDPCAGAGTTLLAAAIEGRSAIGAELNPDTFAKAQKRLARGYTPTLFQESAGGLV